MSTTDAGIDVDGYQAAAPSKPMEITFGLVALIFTATYLALGTQIELRQVAAAGQIDARFWPLLLGTSGVAASVAVLVIALTKPAPSREDMERVQHGGILRVAAAGALTLVYVATWSLGAIIAFGYSVEIFPVATAIYMVLLMLVFGQRKPLGLIIYPVALTAFIYVLFGLVLRVPL